MLRTVLMTVRRAGPWTPRRLTAKRQAGDNTAQRGVLVPVTIDGVVVRVERGAEARTVAAVIQALKRSR